MPMLQRTGSASTVGLEVLYIAWVNQVLSVKSLPIPASSDIHVDGRMVLASFVEQECSGAVSDFKVSPDGVSHVGFEFAQMGGWGSGNFCAVEASSQY